MSTLRSSRAVTALPPVLVVACGVRDHADMVAWRDTDAAAAAGGGATWVPPALRIAARPAVAGRPAALEVLELHRRAPADAATYRVTAVVSNVAGTGAGHGVVHVLGASCVLVVSVRGAHRRYPASDAYARRGGDHPGWYLFNDLRVTRSTAADALSFAATWRTPALLVLTREPPPPEPAAPPPPPPALLVSPPLSDAVFSGDAGRKDIVPLQAGELQPGLLVALDAEFVALQREETETLIDGTSIVAQPSRLALARVRTPFCPLV
jgi:PAB-dependent poly(A)-specific ribonuclease subunit 2